MAADPRNSKFQQLCEIQQSPHITLERDPNAGDAQHTRIHLASGSHPGDFLSPIPSSPTILSDVSDSIAMKQLEVSFSKDCSIIML